MVSSEARNYYVSQTTTPGSRGVCFIIPFPEQTPHVYATCLQHAQDLPVDGPMYMLASVCESRRSPRFFAVLKDVQKSRP